MIEFLIFFIIIIVVIANASSKGKNPKNSQQQNTYEQPRSVAHTSSENEQWQQRARENIEKAARRANQVANKALNDLLTEEGVTSPETEDMTAQERIRARRMEEKNTTILQRAKGNVAENKEDVTLNSMEAEHNHSERVSEAAHHHEDDVITESMLGTIDDLMVKGYDGKLCFDRDFVNEGLDMISRFTVPSEIPNYSKTE